MKCEGCAECGNPDVGRSGVWCRGCEVGVNAEVLAERVANLEPGQWIATGRR